MGTIVTIMADPDDEYETVVEIMVGSRAGEPGEIKTVDPGDAFEVSVTAEQSVVVHERKKGV
jgi:hypothetical protein